MTGGLTGFEQGPQGLSPEEMKSGMQQATQPQNEAQKAGQLIGTAAQVLPWGELAAPKVAIAGAKVIGLIPSAERASAAFNEVSSAVGKNVVPITNDVSKAAMEIWDFSETGARLPKVLKDFVKLATNPEREGATFDQARKFYSNAQQLSLEEIHALKPAVKYKLQSFVRAIGDSIQEVADAGGVGPKFKGTMKEWGAQAQLAEWADKLKGFAWDTAGRVAKGAGYGAGWQGLRMLTGKD
jgi:hypothetical protein